MGTNGLKHNQSSKLHRRRPWQNYIDVSELGRNVTKRERSQQNVARREEMYNHPRQTVVRRRASVTVKLDRPWDNVELENEDKNDQNPTASYVSGCRDCRGCREQSVNIA